MKRGIRTAGCFISISGLGWLIDFGVFFLLSRFLEWDVRFANMVSSIPAVTLVFLVSTRKIFSARKSKVKLREKYLIYLLYQFLLIITISGIGQAVYEKLDSFKIVQNLEVIELNLKLLTKIAITPATMTINFFMMRYLTERL